MMGWQESKVINPFDTLANPNDVPYPAAPVGSVGIIYDVP